MRTLRQKIQSIEWFNIGNKIKDILLDIDDTFVKEGDNVSDLENDANYAVESNVNESFTVGGRVFTITNGIIANAEDE